MWFEEEDWRRYQPREDTKLDETEVKTIAVIPHQGRQAKYFKSLFIFKIVLNAKFFSSYFTKNVEK